MKVTKSILNRISRYTYKNGDWVPACYVILSEEKVTKTITSKIPFTTGYFQKFDENDSRMFPAYLHGFEEYYEPNGWDRIFRLKKEYRDKDSRPSYTMDISYTLYDIELTDEGREIVEERYKMYKRCMERYAKMMGY